MVAISLLYTARNYQLSRPGQVTDRFTKALERLSAPDIERPARRHLRPGPRRRRLPPHHDDVVEVLETSVRRRAPAATTTLPPRWAGLAACPTGPRRTSKPR
ncbi:hypothetical protein [Actinomadura sp. NPDC000929]|uniref:hypothetical protein n=1 Tax=Actinomadura sp. NPDC000929 TaxID=3154517 RepID=UPI00339597AE